MGGANLKLDCGLAGMGLGNLKLDCGPAATREANIASAISATIRAKSGLETKTKQRWRHLFFCRKRADWLLDGL